MRKSRVALGATILGSAIIATFAVAMPAASAATYTLYIKDDGARSKTTVTWLSATRVKTSSEQCDIQADGKGPRIRIGVNAGINTKFIVDDAESMGNGYCDYPQGSADNGGFAIDFVRIDQCNGGVANCDYIELKNPSPRTFMSGRRPRHD